MITRKKKNAVTVPFVSKADTKEIREYQEVASQFPPLEHEELVETAKKFVLGRAAQVALLEEQLFSDILKGDWGESNILTKKKEVSHAFDLYVKECHEDPSIPKDIADALADDAKEMKRSYLNYIQSHHFNDSTRCEMMRKKEIGDMALEKIVHHNMQLAMSRVGRIMKKNEWAKRLGAPELIAVANIGLVLGARQFNPFSGHHFSTYAAFHIDGQLLEYIQVEDGNCGIKSVTLHEQKQLSAIIQTKKVFKNRYNREPTITELQSLTGISAKIIEKRLNCPPVRTQNIYAPAKNTKDDSESFLADILPAEEDVEGELQINEELSVMDCFRRAIANLPDRERRVLTLKAGLAPECEGNGRTAFKIAQELGISSKEVNKIADVAMKRIKTTLEKHGYGLKEIMEIN